MKVLFIGSGNKKSTINSIVLNQGESLKKAGIEIAFYPISGKGISGYLKSAFILRKFAKKECFDLYHAHYSLSAFAASLAGCKPLVASLMGSDVHENDFFRLLIRAFAKFFWQAVIVKSEEMSQILKLAESHVIPNGVDLELFKPLAKEDALSKVGFKKGKNIIFVSDPGRPEKNIGLAKAAVEGLHDMEIRLHPVFGKPNSELAWYYNAADLLLLTSRWEGSPNVIKEAMACNLPIVATDVGDVKEIIGRTEGCCLCSDRVDSVSEGIRKTLAWGKRTNGRERIIDLQLDSTSVSRKIISVYKDVLKMA